MWRLVAGVPRELLYQAAENAKSHGSRLRRGAALP
jgi:hypothetical protein